MSPTEAFFRMSPRVAQLPPFVSVLLATMTGTDKNKTETLTKAKEKKIGTGVCSNHLDEKISRIS